MANIHNFTEEERKKIIDGLKGELKTVDLDDDNAVDKMIEIEEAISIFENMEG